MLVAWLIGAINWRLAARMQHCIRKRRIGVSAAFFVELEFQRTGSFVYRCYKGGLARRPTYQEFNTDRAQVHEGATLETDKQALTLNFVQRAEFVQKYAGLTTGPAFVDALIASIQQASNLNIAAQRQALIDKYNTGGSLRQSRALVLRNAIESTAFVDKEYNAAFVLMQYFGCLGVIRIRVVTISGWALLTIPRCQTIGAWCARF